MRRDPCVLDIWVLCQIYFQIWIKSFLYCVAKEKRQAQAIYQHFFIHNNQWSLVWEMTVAQNAVTVFFSFAA